MFSSMPIARNGARWRLRSRRQRRVHLLSAVLFCGAVSQAPVANSSAESFPGEQIVQRSPAGVQVSEATPTPFWPDVVDTVLVETDRPDIRDHLARGAAFATVIDLGPSVPASRDLGDLLGRLAGLHLHRYGGLGAFTTASVRGSGPQQMQVLLDGFPVGGASEGVPNLSLLPVANLEFAEVFRGARTMLVPGPIPAGTISLHTPASLATPLQLAIGAGSFGTYSARGQWGWQSGPWGLLASLQQRQSEGDFPYANGNGTPHNPEDDRIVARNNNAFRDASWLFKSSLRPREEIRLDYTGLRSQAENGIPGTETIQTEQVRYSRRDRSDQWGLRLRPRFSGPLAIMGRPTMSASIRTGDRREEFENYGGEIGLRRAAEESRGERRAANLSVLWPWIPLGSTIGVLTSGELEEWTPTDLLRQSTSFTRSRRSRSWVLTGHQQLVGRLLFEASYRWDHSRDNFAGPIVFGQEPASSETRHREFEGGAVGARWNLTPSLALKANRSHFARYPTFSELFGRTGWQDGNPTLIPEGGLQWDAGFSLVPNSRQRAEVAYFESITEDKIVWIQNSQRTVKAHNLGRTWARGVETTLFAALALPWQSGAELEVAHTWQEAIDVGPSRTYHGKRLPNLPESEFHTQSTWRRGPWALAYSLTTQGRSYRDRYNSEGKLLHGFALHDLELVRTILAGHASLRFEVRNFSDVRIQDIDGFPLPGRTFFFELRTSS